MPCCNAQEAQGKFFEIEISIRPSAALWTSPQWPPDEPATVTSEETSVCGIAQLDWLRLPLW